MLVSRSLWVDQGAIKELSKDWSCECWPYCKHVLKKKIVWSFMFTFKTSSKWRESERFKHLISSWCSTWTCTRQSWWRSPLDVILSMGCMISSSWRKPMDTYLTPHRLSHRPWVSTQSAMDNAYHTMRSLDPSVHLVRFVCWSTWFTLWLSLDQPLTRPIFR